MYKLRSLPLFLILSVMAFPALAYQQIEFVREIGEPKKSAKQRLMNEPAALALTADKVYIAEADAHRVLVVDLEGKTVRSWGSKGDKPGQFKSPGGIAVDEQGRVYVSDTGNGRIQVFNAEGQFLSGFRGKGSGPKQFSSPSGLVAFRGLLYVADTGNSRVQVLTFDGIYIRQITVKADKTSKDEMKAPVDVALDLQNKIYVLDRDTYKVRIFNPAGVQLGMFGAKGKGTDGFNEPTGLAVDNKGFIYISDSENYKVKKLDSEGKLLGSIGTEGDGPGQFRAATGIKVDKEGKIYVLDAKKNTLQVFSTETGDRKPLAPVSPLPTVEFFKEVAGAAETIAINKRLWGVVGDSLGAMGVISGRTIGSSGSEPAQLKKPRGLSVDPGGNFLVADTGNNRVQKFNKEGDLLLVIGKSGSGEGEFREPSGVSLSPKGNIRVADTGNKRIQVFSPKGMYLGAFGKGGKLPGQFSEPMDVAGDTAGNIYVADRGNDKICKFDENGALLWEAGKTGTQEGELKGPESVLVTPDNEVYVLDAGNNRVQVFDQNGKFLRAFGNEGNGRGEFKAPRGLALESGTILYVGDRGNKRTQAFTLKQTPAVPVELAAQPGMNEVQLSWKPNVETYLEHYKIYRADFSTGVFSLAGTSVEPFYIDRNLPSNRSFLYVVAGQALNGNESAPSDKVTATTPKLVPAAPRKVRIEASEKQLTLSWLPNTEPFMDHYRVYRTAQLTSGYAFLKKSAKTIFTDSPLADEATYYYQVTAVGKEGDESQPSEVIFASTPKASLTSPPLEIVNVELADVFAAAYKYYADHPLGKVVLKNNTDKPYPKVKLSFMVKEYMDYPTETEIEELLPMQTVELPLKPVFSNKILGVTENTSLQSELGLTYHVAGEPKTVTRSFPLTLYERHAMTWDQKTNVGAFVTSKDTAVADFTRLVVQPYVDAYPNLPSSLVYARAVYDALGVYGLTYIIDPTSPFQEFSEKAAAVDYLQYPRDTMARKSGDCDDLSILFVACMENIGIGTALVDVPGHVFIMFNTGVPETEKELVGFPDDQLVLHKGMVWIPVEMTVVGASFTRAWQKGAEEYRNWSAKGKVDIVNIQSAWEQFKPVTLPPFDGKSVKVKRDEIEAKYKGELEALGRQRLAFLSEKHLAALKRNPKDVNALGQLGILYGENGLYAEALEQFQKALALDKGNADALNNVGNVHFFQERLEDAKQAYESALKAAPGDPGIMVNLSRVLFKMGKRDEAKKIFQNAADIDPRMLRWYGDLAGNLGVK